MAGLITKSLANIPLVIGLGRNELNKDVLESPLVANQTNGKIRISS